MKDFKIVGVLILLLALGGALAWVFWPRDSATVPSMLKTPEIPKTTSPITVETPKAAPAQPADAPAGADPVVRKQWEAETMRSDMEKTLAQVRQTIEAEEAKHPEQRASLEAQFAQIRDNMEKDIASAQGPTTDWGVIEFTEGEPVQKTTMDGKIYELIPSRESDGMINVGFAIVSEVQGKTQQNTRSLPGYPMTARIGGGEIKFTPKWKIETPATPAKNPR